MIIDRMDNAESYYVLHPSFKKAFAFLQRADLAALPDGRHEIDGGDVYATLFRGTGNGLSVARLEAHQKYIDIQCVLSGNDIIGLQAVKACRLPIGAYDDKKDIMFFSDMPESRFTLHPGHFIILYPEDAHAPLSGTEELLKVVVKVRI